MTLGPSTSAFVSFLSYHWLFNVATSFVNGPLVYTHLAQCLNLKCESAGRHFQPGGGPWLWKLKLREVWFEAPIHVQPNGHVTAYRECRCSLAQGGDCSPQWIRVSEYYKYLSPATNWNMQPIFLSCRLLTLWTSYLDSLLNRCAVSCCSTSIQSWSSILVPFPSIFVSFWDPFLSRKGYLEYCSWQWVFVLFALCHCPLYP